MPERLSDPPLEAGNTWECDLGNGLWVPYDKTWNRTLFEAEIAGKYVVTGLLARGGSYTVDLIKMLQTNEITGVERSVRCCSSLPVRGCEEEERRGTTLCPTCTFENTSAHAGVLGHCQMCSAPLGAPPPQNVLPPSLAVPPVPRLLNPPSSSLTFPWNRRILCDKVRPNNIWRPSGAMCASTTFAYSFFSGGAGSSRNYARECSVDTRRAPNSSF